MPEKHGKHVKKFYKCHEIILEYVESQSRSSKTDNNFAKCQSFIERAVEINQEQITVAGKSEDPDKLIPAQDIWIHKLTHTHDKTLQEVKSNEEKLGSRSREARGR